jgi:hypothetical protein
MRVIMCVFRSFSSKESKNETNRKRQTESRKESMKTTVGSEPPTHEGLTIGVCLSNEVRMRTKIHRLKGRKLKAQMASHIERTADERSRKVTIMSVNVRSACEESIELKPQSQR